MRAIYREVMSSIRALEKKILQPRNILKLGEIGKQFMKDLMTPHTGMHLDLGASLKLPLMPVGFYIDAKYLVPFGDMDKDISGLKSSGILINSGLSFSL